MDHKKIFQACLTVIFVIISVFTLYAQYIYYSETTIDLKDKLGNFKWIRDRLSNETGKSEFSFAIIGDTKGRGTFEEIADKLKKENLSFAVDLGDFVKKGTEYYHAWFRAEYATEINFPFPMFMVVGNHDIDPIEFPISKFEQLYGPTIFSFPYQGCLFVFLRILPRPYSIEPSIAFLKKLILKNPSKKYRYIFVFMHIPPHVSKEIKARQFEKEDKLISLLAKLRPTYIIAGDYHGYAHFEQDEIIYLVSGGGGARLKRSQYGSFHHAIVITVSKNGISEKILMVKERKDVEDAIERFAIAKFYPAFHIFTNKITKLSSSFYQKLSHIVLE